MTLDVFGWPQVLLVPILFVVGAIVHLVRSGPFAVLDLVNETISFGVYPRGDAGREAIDFRGLNDSWFAKLITMLSRDVPENQIGEIFNNVSFVNFNYDRCLELFLVRGLEALYAITREAAAKAVANLRIFHPYGSVGKLRLDNRDDDTVAFGSTNVDRLQLAEHIQTYSERLEESDELTTMRNEIAQADTLVFLGMQFHDQNLNLVSPTNPNARRIFATGLGLSDADREFVRKSMRRFLHPDLRRDALLKANRIRMEPLRCSELFDTYSKSLPG